MAEPCGTLGSYKEMLFGSKASALKLESAYKTPNKKTKNDPRTTIDIVS